MWGAYGVYPVFRTLNQQMNTFSLMLEYCFRYSMNGAMPPADGPVVTVPISYAYWLSTGAPIGAQLVGRGYRVVPEPAGGVDLAQPEVEEGRRRQQLHASFGLGRPRHL